MWLTITSSDRFATLRIFCPFGESPAGRMGIRSSRRAHRPGNEVVGNVRGNGIASPCEGPDTPSAGPAGVLGCAVARPPLQQSMPEMHIVIAHDYLAQRGGAERVLLTMLDAFPNARVVTSIYSPERTFDELQGRTIETLWTQRVPAFRQDPRLAFPFLGRAFENYIVQDADLVICSTSGWAHGITARVPKIVYCHNPPRWLYQPDDYFQRSPIALRRTLHRSLAPLRKRDVRWAKGADAYVANSAAVARRVRLRYGIAAEIVHPPSRLSPREPQVPIEGVEPGYLLVVSRPRAYKNVRVVQEAVAGLDNERLVVVGGADQSVASTNRIRSLSAVSDSELRWLYQNCDAVVAIAHEDFGLTPVEGFQFGKPAVALRAAGYLDTVSDGVNGVFAEAATAASVREAIIKLRSRAFDEQVVKLSGRRFGTETFAERIRLLASAVVHQSADVA